MMTDSRKRIRVYKIAEQLGIDRSEIVARAAKVGIELTSPMAAVDEDAARQLRQRLGNDAPGGSGVAPTVPELIRRDEDWLLALHRAQFFKILGEEDERGLREMEEQLLPAYDSAVAALIATARANEPELADALRLECVGYSDSLLLETDPHVTDWYFRALDQERPEVRALSTEIDSWTGSRNLRECWVIDTVIRTLMMWRSDGDTSKEHTWYSLSPLFRGLGPGRATLMLSWEPALERRTAARQRLLANVATVVDRYLDEAERMARALDAVSPPRQLADPSTDLRYLVWYQVLRETQTKIARERLRHPDPEESGRRMVGEAVKRSARLIGLTLRDRDPGAAVPRSTAR